MKKIKVRVVHGRNNEPRFVSVEANRRGIYEAYSEDKYNANPEQFEIVTGHVQESSSRVLVDEVTPFGNSNKTLPKPLSELNELIALLSPFRRKRTRDEIVAEAQKMLKEKEEYLRKSKIQESWQAAGLSPEAAEVAARVEIRKRPTELPPVTEWAGLLDKAYGGG
jgi:hypothetical protein